MGKKVHVVHHTHWDFEWYFTNHESFIQLSYHMDEVMSALEENKINYYLLDGQMSILDEYLQSFPEQKTRLARLVRAGRLRIGPWYTQTDELIVSGESIVRNLTMGMALSEELGGYMNIGYLPDSFGQSKDMPKIYNGLGIDCAVFWRGVPEDRTTDREFFWTSEDGSSVMTSNIKNGYFVGVGLIYEENYQGLMDVIEKGAVSDTLVLPVGGDQRYVDLDLRERIDRYNAHLAEYELVESTYDQFFDALEPAMLKTVTGEFISSSVSKIHRSIYSSRYDHKYFNDKIERRMIYHVEPLMVMAEQLGIPYKKGVLDRIWKLLAKNQAHDSAGGCNSDKTNKIISERFVEADQLSYSLVDYLTRKIAESRTVVKEDEVTVFNPLPWVVKKVIPVTISSEKPQVTFPNLPCEQVKTTREYNGSIRRTVEEMDESKFYYIHQLLVEVELPPFSFETYQVEAVETAQQQRSTAEQGIENAKYQLSYHDGQLDLHEKITNKLIVNALRLEDSGDEGDTYDYSPPYEDDRYLLDFKDAQVQTTKGSLAEVMTLSGTWYVAKNLEERGKKERTQAIHYALQLTLKKGSEQLECHLEIDNQALDHRMRVLIQTPTKNNYSYADTPFGTIRREAEDKHLHDWRELGWREEPTAIFPLLHFVNVHDSTGSMTAFAKGIKEYQLVGEDFSQLALTLFRSVGFLGRPDLIRRPGIASGNEFKYIPTPDSQLQQTLKFKFALRLETDYQPAKLARAYTDYAVSVPYYQIQELNRFTNTLKYFVSNPLPDMKQRVPSIELSSETVVFSSLRKSTNDAGFDVRVYNPDPEVSVDGGQLSFVEPVQYEWVDLKGEPLSRRNKNGKIELGLFKPGEIKTVHIC